MNCWRSPSVFSGSQEGVSASDEGSGARKGERRMMAPIIQNGGNTGERT